MISRLLAWNLFSYCHTSLRLQLLLRTSTLKLRSMYRSQCLLLQKLARRNSGMVSLPWSKHLLARASANRCFVPTVSQITLSLLVVNVSPLARVDPIRLTAFALPALLEFTLPAAPLPLRSGKIIFFADQWGVPTFSDADLV